jgi:2-phospho-L-lactate guanylyltransferase (CobY/MobA/RfbA family)
MPLTFGEPSFERHLATARARNLSPRVLTLPGLGLDIDTPEDLTALVAQPNTTETGALVASWLPDGRFGLKPIPHSSHR